MASAVLQLPPGNVGAASAREGAALAHGKRQRSAGEVEEASLSKRPRPRTPAAEAAPMQRAKPAAQGASAVNNSAAEAGGGRLKVAKASAAGEVALKKRKARPTVPHVSTSALDRCAAEAGASMAAAAKKKRTAGSRATAGASNVCELAAAPDDDRAGAGAVPAAPHKRKALAKAAGKARGAPVGSGDTAGASGNAAAARKAQRVRKVDDKRAPAGGAGPSALGGVPTDPERRASWLARVAELAAARKPTDKPLPRPMRLALKQKLREDKRAAMMQRAEARASLLFVLTVEDA